MQKKKKKRKLKKATKHKKTWGDQGWEEGKKSLSKVGKHEDMKTNFKI